MPFSGPYGRRFADIRLDMFPIRKLGATYLNLWTGSRIQKPEVLSKMPEIVRNVKFTVIRKNASQKGRGQTGSSCVLWLTFDLNSLKLRNGAR